MSLNPQDRRRIAISDSLPAWSRELVERVRALADLEENSDAYGARRIDPDCAEAAIELILSVLGPGVPAPAVVPTIRGGLQLEWHRGGVDAGPGGAIVRCGGACWFSNLASTGKGATCGAVATNGESGQNVVDDARRLDAGEAHVEALIGNAESFVIDAKQVQHCGMQIADVDDESESMNDERRDANYGQLTNEILSYAIGCILGRLDVRYTTGARRPPELPDPFAPLPVCSAGMLQGADGLPAKPEDVPDDYPLRIDRDGILVDDAGIQDDIVRRVREVLEVIWKDQADAIEKEACEILGVTTLRDYFRKPGKGAFGTTM